MRWVVELPGPSGGTAATVTVDAESWLSALNKARGGIALAKYHAEIDDDGTVRVLDRVTRDRFTVRQMKSLNADAQRASALPPEPPLYYSAPPPPPEAPANIDAAPPSASASPGSIEPRVDAPLFFSAPPPADSLFNDPVIPSAPPAPPLEIPAAPSTSAASVDTSMKGTLGPGVGAGSFEAPSAQASSFDSSVKHTLGPGVQAGSMSTRGGRGPRSPGSSSDVHHKVSVPMPGPGGRVNTVASPPAAGRSSATSSSSPSTPRAAAPSNSSVAALALDYQAPAHAAEAPKDTSTPAAHTAEASTSTPPATEHDPVTASAATVSSAPVEAPVAALEAPVAALEAPVEAPVEQSPPVAAPAPAEQAAPAPAAEAAPGAGEDSVVIRESYPLSLNGTALENTRSDTMVIPTGQRGDEPADALPIPTVLYERDAEPSASSPIIYRERVFAVAEGTDPARAEALARHAFAAIKRSLATRPRGRFVTIAVFDHEFASRPTRPPLVVLRWKDWRGEPEVELPPRDAPMVSREAPPVTPPVTAPNPVEDQRLDTSNRIPSSALVTINEPPAVPTSPAAAVRPSPTPPQTRANEARERKQTKNKRKRARTNSESRISTAPALLGVQPAQPTSAAASADTQRDMPTLVVPVFVAPSAEKPAPTAPEAAATVITAPEPSAPATTEPEPVAAAAAPVAAAPEPAVVVATTEAVQPATESPATVVEASNAASPADATVAAPVEARPEPAPEPAPSEPAPAVAEAPVAEPVTAQPVVAEPVAEAPVAAEPPPVAAPPPVAEPPSVAEPKLAVTATVSEAAPAAEAIATGPRAEPAPEPVSSAAAADVVVAPARSIALSSRRRRGKDLVSDLFDALMDLSFANGVDDACAFAARVLRDTLLVDACTVSVYDIDRDEFVVTAAEGLPSNGARVKATGGHRGNAVRKHAGVCVKVCDGSESLAAAYASAPALFAPAYSRDRLFAMLVLQRAKGGPVFESDEEDGVNYVAAQLGEALSNHSRRAAAAEYNRDSKAPKRR